MSKAFSFFEQFTPTQLDNYGIYLHVPYCHALCHYCDFAKTANFRTEHIRRYCEELASHINAWLEFMDGTPLKSVFLGGGTPSILDLEVQSLLKPILPLLQKNAEVSLEANPDDITHEKLKIWRDAGITRLSIGIQTFDNLGLTWLKRNHDQRKAFAAIELAQSYFEYLSIDLIYGWEGQSEASWLNDLEQVRVLNIPHVSLYSLTFEERTPIGRQKLRGLIEGASDDLLFERYEIARSKLAEIGFEHYEISNWSKPGFNCQHNLNYWSDGSYVGVGSGAHGYLKSLKDPGTRYAYDRNDRKFMQGEDVVHIEPSRTLEGWFFELLGSGLRTKLGIPWHESLAKASAEFQPRPVVGHALTEGILRVEGGRLYLAETEWFREAGWATELLASIKF